MTIGSNTSQPRDMAEVRNHLKWLDEERRKTARKIAELEQRIAQQGREITERGQRIQDLEWQLGRAVERLERMPEVDTNTTSQEQRLQDMEWHLSNVNTQLVRLTKLEEEIGRGREERTRITAAMSDLRERIATVDGQLAALATLEDQVTSLGAMRDELASVESRVTALGVLDDEVTSLRDRVMSMPIFDVAAYDGALLSLRKRMDGIPDFDEQMSTFRTQITAAMDEYESRTTTAVEQAELNLRQFAESTQFSETYDRLTRIEESLGGLSAIREAVTQLSRLEQELDLRQAEEVRLANLIGLQDEKLAPLVSSAGVMQQSVQDLESRIEQTNKALEDVRVVTQELGDIWRPRLEDTRRQIGPLADRLDGLYSSLPKLETALESMREDQRQLRDKLELLNDHVTTSQDTMTRQLDTWQSTQDEQKETVERFTQQWLTLSNQYKEARMAVQNFAHWQKQLEQQKKEASELVRIESNRMQSRWEGFLLEIQERFKNAELDLGQKWQSFEMENEQRWASVRRTEKQWRDELAAIDELILKMQQDNRNLIWRVQAAQADAIKKWPRLLLEEVEKAVEMNPQRRLQPAAAATPRTEMSVVDALEQGLIKIDYENKPESDGN